jgi:hypothetical protein
VETVRAGGVEEPMGRVGRRELTVTVVVVGLACLVLWRSAPMLPLRLLVTLVHEAGHATAAMLTGASVQSVTINPSEGGLTLFSLPADAGPWRIVTIGSAGYVGTALVGGALLEVCARLGRARIVLAVLAALVAAIGLAWVPWSTDPGGLSAAATGSSSGDGRFTIVFCVVTIAVLAGVAVQPSVRGRRVVLVAVATALCLGAVEDLRLVLEISRSGGHSDASIVAAVAPFPPWFWAGSWLLLGVAACGLGLWSALVRSPERRPGSGLSG